MPQGTLFQPKFLFLLPAFYSLHLRQHLISYEGINSLLPSSLVDNLTFVCFQLRVQLLFDLIIILLLYKII